LYAFTVGTLSISQITSLIVAITTLLGVLIPVFIALGWITAKQVKTAARAAGAAEAINGTVSTLTASAQEHAVAIARIESAIAAIHAHRDAEAAAAQTKESVSG
jgi:hypothetical protein